MLRRLAWQTITLAAARARTSAGRSRQMRMAMMPMTVRSSIKVKARRFMGAPHYVASARGSDVGFVLRRRVGLARAKSAMAERQGTFVVGLNGFDWVCFVMPRH